MRRARRCRADLVARIFEVYAVSLQRFERFAQRAHAVELKRDVVDRVRMWSAFEEPDDNRAVRQRDRLIGPEHFPQIEVLGPKLRALLWVSDGKAEMPDRAKFYFHVLTSQANSIRSTHCERHAAGASGSPKYCVSRNTLSS